MPVVSRAGQLPADARDLPVLAAQEHVEELHRRVEVAREERRGVIRRTGKEVAVVLMVDRFEQQVLVARPRGPSLQLAMIVPGPRRAVVPPADRHQDRDGGGVERVPGREAPQVDRVREPDVVRRGAAPDRLEERLDLGRERPARPVELPFQHVPIVEHAERVEPGDAHLHVVRALPGERPGQLAEPGAGDARRDRPQRRVAGGDRGPLRVAVVGVPPHPDDAVRPLLLDDPVEGVVPVVGLVDEEQRLALGAELPADVLNDHGVAAGGEVIRDSRHERVFTALVVREPGEHDRSRRHLPRGQVDVGRQPDAVPHPDHVLGGGRRDRAGTGPVHRERHQSTSKKRMQTWPPSPRASPTKTDSCSQRWAGASVLKTGLVR